MYRSQKKVAQQNYIIEIIGWFGVAAILLAYALLSFSIVQNKSTFYIVLNIAGSAALIFQSYSKRDYEPAALNAVWIALSLIALWRVL